MVTADEIFAAVSGWRLADWKTTEKKCARCGAYKAVEQFHRYRSRETGNMRPSSYYLVCWPTVSREKTEMRKLKDLAEK